MPEIIEVILENTQAEGAERSFRIDHAVALLRYEKANKLDLWRLPATSKYIFTDDGNIIERPGPKADQGTQARQGDSEGQTETDQAQATHGTGNRNRKRIL